MQSTVLQPEGTKDLSLMKSWMELVDILNIHLFHATYYINDWTNL